MPNARGETAMNERVIEWAPCRLRKGVDEATLLKLAERLQSEFLGAQKGYVRRELVRGKDGEYVDIVWWSTMEDAETAMKNVSASQACNAYFAAMDFDPADPDAAPLHFRVLREFSPTRMLA
jgi:hypothetical protein